MTYVEFLSWWPSYKAGEPWRQGQRYYNALFVKRKDIAEQLIGSRLDPFHFSEIPQETHDFVEKAWKCSPSS